MYKSTQISSQSSTLTSSSHLALCCCGDLPYKMERASLRCFVIFLCLTAPFICSGQDADALAASAVEEVPLPSGSTAAWTGPSPEAQIPVESDALLSSTPEALTTEALTELPEVEALPSTVDTDIASLGGSTATDDGPAGEADLGKGPGSAELCVNHP